MWALILAGGFSRRMGRSKQDLPFGAGTLLERTVAAAREFAEEVVLVGDDAAASRLGLRAAQDWQAGAGPLSGLAGGLAVCPEGPHALLACDLPFLTGDLLRRMESLAGQAHAVVPVVEGRRHPLCALYHTDCLQPAQACLSQDRRRMDDLLDRVELHEVTPEQVLPLDLVRAVMNVNTPEQYQQALEFLETDEHGP
ncbi:MAG: molybdenum cofactor guanylyltransferase [Acidobacteria bacterium]|nr:molybdenum cofactor guanylyltransferase [Acidobacteriota bacterium]